MKAHLLCPILFMTFFIKITAQGVGVGTTVPDSSSIVEMESTSKGMLMPRMSTSQRKAIENPAQGLLVFDTDKTTIYMFDGDQWMPLMFTANELLLPVTPLNGTTDGASDDNWGSSIDIDGDYAIIGAPNDDIDADSAQGSAYIFYRDNGNWTEQKKLILNAGIVADHFGVSVAIDGDYAIVGADGIDLGGIDKGSAFIFKRNGTNWNFLARLHAFDGDGGDHFGYSVDLQGDYAVAGAYDAGISLDGLVYVFHKEGEWVTNQTYQEKLVSPSMNASQFGTSVSLSGNEILIGDPWETFDSDVFRGAAYIFARLDTNWVDTARIFADDGDGGDNFGNSVSLDGDYAVIGADNDRVGTNNNQGSAYVYYRDQGWTNGHPWQGRLFAPDGNTDDLFGMECWIQGDFIVIGAPGKDIGGVTDTGGAYLYKRNDIHWPLYRKLDVEVPVAEALAGTSICINNYNILIGAPGTNNGKGQIQFLNIE